MLVSTLGAAVPVVALAADFNADGNADLLWRQGDGKLVLWLMNGASAPQRLVLGNALDESWAIAGSGSFTGVGDRDVLLMNANSTGQIWTFDGSGRTGSCALSTVASLGNEFLGLADVDGDGKTDVVWRRPNGDLRFWFMNGCTVSTVDLTGVVGSSWTFVVAADFNGDGKADLLWRDGASTLHLWTMNGAQIAGSSDVSTDSFATWDIVASGDFDGDGHADLLWRASDGQLAMWLMNGASHSDVFVSSGFADSIFRSGFESAADTGASGQYLPLSWHVLPASDVDGDGHADILAVDAAGNVLLRRVNGAAALDETVFAADAQMPYPGNTGWTLPLERPTVTSANGQVDVTWPLPAGYLYYSVYAGPDHDPALSGTAYFPITPKLSYLRSDPTFATARYFSVDASFFGFTLPPSPEAYLVDFDQTSLGYWGSMALGDLDADGCLDVLGASGDCLGGFSWLSESAMGLSALRSTGRSYNDIRFADFDGDGVDDAIANVYSSALPPANMQSHTLFFRGLGNGQFVEDSAFSALQLGGFGETIVVADFDNDGDLDVYLPNYTFYSSGARCYLLVNDGAGHFTESAVAAGVDMPNWDVGYRPEGVQAVDVNDDGLIDIYAGSHLYINRTVAADSPQFVDERAIRGLPIQFDEGAKFIDWNADGLLDLVLQYPYAAPTVYQFDGYGYTQLNVTPTAPIYNQVFGLNAADVDGDGLPDLVVAGGCSDNVHPDCTTPGTPHALPKLLLNRGTAFVLSDFYSDGLADTQRPFNDLQSYADFDGDGGMDLVTRYSDSDPDAGIPTGDLRVLHNRGSGPSIRVRLLGANGQFNQFGRPVRVSPLQRPGFIMTQAVDGGSGYKSNSPYDLVFAANYPGSYTVTATFAGAVTVQAMARPGDVVEMRENGSVQIHSGAAGAQH